MGMSRRLVEPMGMSFDVCHLWYHVFGLIGRRLKSGQQSTSSFATTYIVACGIDVWEDHPFMKVLSS